MKHRVRDVELNEFSFGKRTFQVIAQNLQFLGAVKICAGAEVVGHDEAASSNILPKVRDLLVIENHEARLGQIKEGVLENFRTAELHDLVGIGPDADPRQF